MMITKLCVDLDEAKKIANDLMAKGKEVKVFKCKDLLFIREEKVQFIVCYKG